MGCTLFRDSAATTLCCSGEGRTGGRPQRHACFAILRSAYDTISRAPFLTAPKGSAPELVAFVRLLNGHPSDVRRLQAHLSGRRMRARGPAGACPFFARAAWGPAASRQPLSTARSWHSWTTCTLSRRPVARVHDRACLDSVTFEVFAHCGIAPNLGKTRVLSLDQTAPPPGIGELGAEINCCQSEAPSCSACSSPARSSSEPGPTSGCKRSSACCRNYPSCHPVARGPTTPSAGSRPTLSHRMLQRTMRPSATPTSLLACLRGAPPDAVDTVAALAGLPATLGGRGLQHTTGSACCILAWADGRPSRLPCTLPGIRGFLRAGAGKTVSDSGAVPTTCSWRSHAASVGRQSESFVGGPAGWCPPATTTQGRQTAARRRRWQLASQDRTGKSSKLWACARKAASTARAVQCRVSAAPAAILASRS